ncbi:hypothetical protein [Streptomyces sp. NPDC058735]|uniref:hypothetical protein n=1 Tax=unclassified Streptomyces TaxID=2593676 RepID=UPI003688DE6D
MSHDRKHARDEETDNGKRPETALEEVFREVEDAETRVPDAAERRHRGEAGEAVTPNTRAQEESRGD